LLTVSLTALFVSPALAQQQQGGGAAGTQRADPDFDASVKKPEYAKDGPKLVIDEAHFNVHKADGQYKPFATLAANDGYRVTSNTRAFTAESLAEADVLVIANARGEDRPSEKPAFTDAECDAVRDWVKGGGNLLLVTDHYPIGHGSAGLAARFEVDMSKGTTTDAANAAPGAGGASALLYSRGNGLLKGHPLTDGRTAEERLNHVVTFTGLSLKGPDGSTPFLTLADTARDHSESWAAEDGPRRRRNITADNTSESAAGRAQGIALTFGKGRVVILGEASMLSAQLTGRQGRPMGMNHPGTDNRQLALNILHWLSRAIP